MANQLILISGSAFLAVLAFIGWRLNRAGIDLKGRPPIPRPLFLTGKAAMIILWVMMLWRAAMNTAAAAGPDSSTWLAKTGAFVFSTGCGLALIAFAALGRQTRFGLPVGECRLESGGVYGWARHPMYAGFYLMSLGACLYLMTPLTIVCLLLAVGVHHQVVLAEERFMAGRFGSTWHVYANRVPRYGIPGRGKT